eukprot:jgi/Botrbrau1/9748/Bobra.0388s0035.1
MISFSMDRPVIRVISHTLVAGIWPLAWVLLLLSFVQGVQNKVWSRNSKSSLSALSIGASIKLDDVRLALQKSWWEAADFSHIKGMRFVKVNDALSKEDLDIKFPTPTTMVGPASIVEATIYGRDVTYPLQPIAAVNYSGYMFKIMLERVCYAEVRQMGFSVPKAVNGKRVVIGLAELLTSLPGPASSRCPAKFSESDFRSAVIWLEVWFKRETLSILWEFIGDDFFAAYKRWMHRAMAYVGFPQIYFQQMNAIYQKAALEVLKPHHFNTYPQLSFHPDDCKGFASFP